MRLKLADVFNQNFDFKRFVQEGVSSDLDRFQSKVRASGHQDHGRLGLTFSSSQDFEPSREIRSTDAIGIEVKKDDVGSRIFENFQSDFTAIYGERVIPLQLEDHFQC